MKKQAKLFVPFWFLGYGRWGLPMMGRLDDIKQAGFAGVEILLSNNVCKRVPWFRQKAWLSGLDVRWHQCWKLRDDPSMWFNHVLDGLHMLPRKGLPLAMQIPKEVTEPVVVYADEWLQAMIRSNFLLQSIAVPTPQCRDEKYEFPYSEFLQTLRFCPGLRVVFDTQHVLEYALQTYGVENIPIDPRIILDCYSEFWREFRDRVQEIHLCDTRPAWGHLKGRNIFPGDGVIPLREFLHDIVGPVRWDIPITPEVSPRRLRGRSFYGLRYKVEQLLD